MVAGRAPRDAPGGSSAGARSSPAGAPATSPTAPSAGSPAACACSPPSSPPTSATAPAPPVAAAPPCPSPAPRGAWRRDGLPARRPDRLHRPRPVRRAVPGVGRARRVGLPDRRSRRDPGGAARPRAPRGGGLPQAGPGAPARRRQDASRAGAARSARRARETAGRRRRPAPAFARGAAQCRCHPLGTRRARRCGSVRRPGHPARVGDRDARHAILGGHGSAGPAP